MEDAKRDDFDAWILPGHLKVNVDAGKYPFPYEKEASTTQGSGESSQEHSLKRKAEENVSSRDALANPETDDITAVTEADAESRAVKKQKVRGQNKNRPATVQHESIRICNEFASSGTCSRLTADGKGCKYEHDLRAFFDSKGPDLGPVCHNYEKFGSCHYGVRCRWAMHHTDPVTLHQRVEEDKVKAAEERGPEILNGEILGRAFFKDVKKRQIPTPKSDEFEAIADAFLKERKDRNAALLEAAKKRKALKAQEDEAASEGRQDSVEKSGGVPMEDDSSTNKGLEGVSLTVETTNDHGAKVLKYADEQPTAIRIARPEKKKYEFAGKSYLAPLTTVGNLPFRRICKSFGVDITCGEMAMAFDLCSGEARDWTLMRRHRSEDFFGVQLAGNGPNVVNPPCEIISRDFNVDFIDLNCGCPLEPVTKKGAGASLLERPAKLADIVRGMNYVTGHTPVTVKLRTGFYDSKPLAEKLIPRLRQWGVSAITVHGRSREARYSKLADWKYILDKITPHASAEMIDEQGEVIPPVAIFGNGDVLHSSDYWARMMGMRDLSNESELTHVLDAANGGGTQTGGVAGVMIGRGALIKPWIFTEIKERRVWDISSGERFDMLRDFTNYGLETWGSDTMGVSTTRRFLCEWMSFLCRYVPVGLLERPQKLNHRVGTFYGRNDLETLMGSPKSSDWIKISEMLLGPAPDFKFVPK
ncbi:hypothetical protein BJ742DRAFT_774973 [Cladochytrium replicatum]|nr:hypothetical protein BJ742DRAFT_774973 [Cladochytrium replicatum]